MVLLLEHGIAYLLSILVISVIVVISSKIIHTKPDPRGFLEIIRDQDGYPSLSLFQFYLWTIVISFGFLSIYLIRIFEGVHAPPIEELPANILALMGISTMVPIVRHKMLSTNPLENKKNREKFSSILQDKKGKPTLSKFQMFTWTIISIIIYLAILFSTVSDISDPDVSDFEQEQCKNNKYFCLTFPDIDPSLIVLMGLSQTAYLGYEYYGKKRTDVKLQKDEKDKEE